jgi:N-acetylglucosamine-6-sulfatase
MTRRRLLQAVGAAAPPVLRAQPRRRNIVFILTDDHRFDFAGALGHPWLKTPHLDRLVRGGACFRNAFVTTSLCSPSRASILTGRYMHAHKVVDNFTPLDPSIPTFPEMLQKAGYRTGFVGKWHMGGESDERRAGFDHWVSFLGQGQYFDPQLNRNGRRETVKGYITDILTGEAARFIRENASRPFLLYLSHKAVHYDFQPAPGHRTLYSSNRCRGRPR